MNLQLAVKSEYFDSINVGDKLEEFRLFNEYWKKRLVDRDYDKLIITKGYPKREDLTRRLTFKYDSYTVKTITHPHFGSLPVKVFAIKIGVKLIA